MLEAHAIDVLPALAACPPSPGLSAVARRQREQAMALAAAENLGKGSYRCRIVPLDGIAQDTLLVGGERLAAPLLIPESGELTAVACGVCTLGTALEDRAAELFADGRRSLALALGSLGNELLFGVSRLMEDRLMAEARRRRLSMAGELRSGDPGLALDTQAAVVGLAGGAAIGVEVSERSMLRPVKSTSAIFGIGIDLPEVRWSRCDACPFRGKCRMAGHRADAAES